MQDGAEGGWVESAAAWIAEQGEHGDFGRRFVLDAPMAARIREGGFRRALDVGCGEGRFCRIMQAMGLATVGIDPVEALIARARACDPTGDYRLGRAESLDLGDAGFDLVVSYLTLIDIDDLATATSRMAAALRPGGSLLVANLNAFFTAGMPEGWRDGEEATRGFRIDHYLEPRQNWVSWSGIRVRNWHRPLGLTMQAMLAQGLTLRHFSEPEPSGGDARRVARYRRVPYFHIMEWQKPAG